MKSNFEALRTAIESSITLLATPRKNRISAIKQYVGNHYSDGGSERVVPTNFLELAVTIYVRQLAARAPSVMISTDDAALRPYALDFELALNQLPEEINLSATLRRAVVEAMFSFAVVKVGIASSGRVVLGQDYGKPFVDLVPLDDYFCDMSAKTRDSIQFEGNDYWIGVDEAREMFSKTVEPDQHTVVGAQGEGRAESVSSGEGASIYQDRVWLRDVYLPRERRMITYGVKSKTVFRDEPWTGPDSGPYRMLGFSDVPGNLLPLPPVALWIDLHELGNSLFRKLGRQAEAKKTVAAFGGGNDESINSLKRAADGEGIRYDGQKPDAITVGGIDAPTLAFYLQVRDLFSYFGGNLDSLGGLSPMADTVGQDKMLTEAASARVKSMGESVVDFAKGIFADLAWYEWQDPVGERKVAKPIAGTDMSIPVKWSAETRKGDFDDYNFELDVYSMQDDTPSTKMQKIGTALERFVFPILPNIEAQGGQVDFEALIALIAQLSNISELTDIVKFVRPMATGDSILNQGAAQQGSMKPTNTTRTYERVNRPGATRSGNDNTMSRLLMGGGIQASEAAALGRSTR
jgi:hypothetical protein